MLGLDTSAVIDLFRGVPQVKAVLEQVPEPLGVTRMSYLELMFGIDVQDNRHVIEEKFYDAFFETVRVFELDSDACKEAGRIFWHLSKRGLKIDEADCVIAAILLKQGVNKILTRNKKHFERIPGIKLI